MRQATKKFRPRAWSVCVTLAFVALCLWAGNWQLERRQQKMALFTAFDSAIEAGESGVLVADELAPAYRYRKFRLRGRYDSERQILLDGMTLNGRAGYQVLTPLLLGTRAVLINRGWIEANPDRRQLPDVTVGTQPRYVRGRLDRLPRPGIVRAAEPPPESAPWPRRLVFPTALEIEQQLGIALYDYQLLLDEADADGFARKWRPRVSGPERHFGYAVQWFAFAALALILFVMLNRRRVLTDDD